MDISDMLAKHTKWAQSQGFSVSINKSVSDSRFVSKHSGLPRAFLDFLTKVGAVSGWNKSTRQGYYLLGGIDLEDQNKRIDVPKGFVVVALTSFGVLRREHVFLIRPDDERVYVWVPGLHEVPFVVSVDYVSFAERYLEQFGVFAEVEQMR